MDERTTEILNRFSSSWIAVEAQYDELIDSNHNWKWLTPLRQFVAKLKRQGEDKYFRLGTAVYFLIISRSVEHGLRPDQKSILIEPFRTGDYQITLRGDGKIYRQYRIENLDDPRLIGLLTTLKHTLVD